MPKRTDISHTSEAGPNSSPPPSRGRSGGGASPRRHIAEAHAGHIRHFAKSQRLNATEAEKKLWQHLRQNQLGGFRFRRQCPIDQYIVDFLCPEMRLIVELDGGQHNESAADKERTRYLMSQGFHVLRFWNHDVLSNTSGVLDMLHERLMSLSLPPHPNPPPQGGRERERAHA